MRNMNDYPNWTRERQILAAKLSRLVNTYNHVTCPWIPLTDWQHTRRRQVARGIMARLRRDFAGCYRELESGRLSDTF